MCVCCGERGGGGYSDIFIHTYGLDRFVWFKILKFNIYFIYFFLGGGGVGGSEKMNCGYFWGIIHYWTNLGGYFIHFRAFS